MGAVKPALTSAMGFREISCVLLLTFVWITCSMTSAGFLVVPLFPVGTDLLDSVFVWSFLLAGTSCPFVIV